MAREVSSEPRERGQERILGLRLSVNGLFFAAFTDEC